MARKKHHELQHDDDTELAVDDEPEAGWTEDTEGARGAARRRGATAGTPARRPPPPQVRLQAVIAQLQHHAAHNAPVPPSAIKELQALATAIAQGPAPAMPVIDSLDPATAPEGTINMTVTGQNFSAASVLCYGDVNQTTTVSPDLTQLTATFESGAPGIYDVNVHDPPVTATRCSSRSPDRAGTEKPGL